MQRLFFMACLVAIAPLLNATVYYVATDGQDMNPGTGLDQPLASISKAIDLVLPGDTILVRGGIYLLDKKIGISKSGEPESILNLWAFPGETPILDFSNLPADSNDRGIKLNARYWYIKGFVIRNARDNGMIIDAGHFNVIQDCVFHNNRDTGLQISGGSAYNEVINCDSYFNKDDTYENADGFAAKLNIGSGNRFIGCRAWNNCDDGWDLYEGQKPVEISFCMAFKNGYLEDGSPAIPNGDMNGFKLGGNGVAAHHVVSNCLAFKNGAKGFDQNNNGSILTLLNNTAWSNGTYNSKPNFSFPNRQNIFKNNISYQSPDDDRLSIGESVNNSWDGFTVSDEDFVSLIETEALNPRKPDGNLPDMNFLKLAAGSDMVDAGVNVGYPYFGMAPDLGAWETDDMGGQAGYFSLVIFRTVHGITNPASNLFPTGKSILIEAVPFNGYMFKEWTGSLSSSENPLSITMESNIFLQPLFIEDTSSNAVNDHIAGIDLLIYPNPVKDLVTLVPAGLQPENFTIAISDAIGRLVLRKEYFVSSSGDNIQLDLSSFDSGIYIVTIQQGSDRSYYKIIKE